MYKMKNQKLRNTFDFDDGGFSAAKGADRNGEMDLAVVILGFLPLIEK
jgi:hypothetical protein